MNIDNALEDVASHFSIRGEIVSCEKHGNGNVNDTFLVKCQEEGEENLYTLQKINHHVFKNPDALMRNFERVTSHLLQKSLEQNQWRRGINSDPLHGRKFIFPRSGR